MPRLATIVVLSVFAAACQGGGGPGATGGPQPAEHSLAGIAAQHVAVLPAYTVRLMPDWNMSIPRPPELLMQLDADILAAMDERGLRKAWVFPAQLERSYEHNTTYATDPHAFAEEPLRSPGLAVDMRLPEPLASQVRTLVAFEQDVRLVLAPVELRLEKAGNGGRGVLRLVLIDARLSNVRWYGDVVSDTVSTFGPAVTASIAARLAGVVAPQ
ncbi:MAG TPA: hypothetical protein VN706_23045 [Gemmatimonadaceae bacterium]|nr:hypothetical protein [Gemmatimonadaceae bacterium]